MALRDQIKRTLREYQLDPMYGKRPDMLVDKLEQLFLKELRAAHINYSRPKLTASGRSLVTNTKPAKKRLASIHDC